MQLLLLALVAAIFIYDELPPRPIGAGAGVLLAIAVLPKLAMVGGYALAQRWGRRRLARSPAVVRRVLDRVGGVYRVSALVLMLVDLYVGVLAGLRGAIGDLVLLDELIVLAGPVGMLVAAWALEYPIDRRLREAALLRRVDAGEPVGPLWTRGQYVAVQLRHHVALVMLPLLAILAWSELVPVALGPLLDATGRPDAAAYAAQLGGALAIFALAPLIIRFVWDTRPVAAGELRDMLLDLCQRHRVTVREVLLWRTAGSVVNAAVLGLLAPVRYILLTDALLERLPRPHLEAVMAHELAHLKRRHMFWLAASAIATLALAEAAISRALVAADVGIDDTSLMVLAATGAAAAWIVVFGWVSRRAERQADAFAVQHLAAGQPVIGIEHAGTMIRALGDVARLNHIPPGRHNWRHGSIAWRQQYLQTLVGKPTARLGIDRLMDAIKLATAAAGATAVALQVGAL